MTRVAIVGGGAAGIGAAHALLGAGLDVTIIDSAPRPGGNCTAVEVRDAAGRIHRIDAGVSDFNRETFHELARLIDELGLATQPIGQDADFVAADGRSRLSSRGGRWRFGAGVRDPERLCAEIDAFRRRAVEALTERRFVPWTLGQYLDHVGASRELRRLYLYPRAMGCFPMPGGDPARFSLLALIRFWRTHGLVGAATGDRRCVIGGMHRWVEAWAERFRGRGGTLLCATRVAGVTRRAGGVELRLVERAGRRHRLAADHVIFACHARGALALLDEPTGSELGALAGFPCQRARLVVHHDERLLGADPDRRGAFNYLIPADDWPRVRPTITFFPNRLAGLPPDVPDTFVTMNPAREPRPDRVLAERTVLHPILDARCDERARRVDALQGERRTWYAGAHLVAPAVHESALLSGLRAAARLLEREAAAGAHHTGSAIPGTAVLRAVPAGAA